MKSTVVDESLSSNKTNVLFQRISAYFNTFSLFFLFHTTKENKYTISAHVALVL